MRGRAIAFALTMVVLALVLDSTVFAPGRIYPFDAAPNVTLVVVVAVGRYLDPEPALLVGFTGGLLFDLLGGRPLGLWAIALTVVAYLTIRYRDRADHGIVAVSVGLVFMTLVGHTLFVLAGTLFGEPLLTDPGVLKLLVLPALYNVVVAGVVVPLVTKVMREERARSWA